METILEKNTSIDDHIKSLYRVYTFNDMATPLLKTHLQKIVNKYMVSTQKLEYYFNYNWHPKHNNRSLF